ncbi:hypothetical protein [Lactobacillus amylovorus]|nr:hypothetical protein [Lactobacillus amylovorus]
MKNPKHLDLSRLKKVDVVAVESEIVDKQEAVSYSRTEPRPNTTISYIN